MRYMALGYKAIAITDHADYSNIESVCNAVLEFCRRWPKSIGIKVLPGIELTHLPLEQFKPLAKYARKRGIKIIVAHGETLVEPVIKGTNRVALEADIDILAHPGLISEKDALLAKKRGIFLEVTTRHGHCETNAFVAKRALKAGARLIINNDSHAPEDIISPREVMNFARHAGLGPKEINRIYQDVSRFINKREAK